MNTFGLPLPALPKRRVFVSYHHENDQAWYDLFSTWYGETLELFTNRSLKEPIDSDAVDYLHRTIREGKITGTSLTIVLCGPETWKRKWVDWEIGSTLNKGHGLLGIGLPTVATNRDGSAHAPDRLLQNYQNSYAPWLSWGAPPPTADEIKAAIARAASNASTLNCNNTLPFMTRNRP